MTPMPPQNHERDLGAAGSLAEQRASNQTSRGPAARPAELEDVLATGAREITRLPIGVPDAVAILVAHLNRGGGAERAVGVQGPGQPGWARALTEGLEWRASINGVRFEHETNSLVAGRPGQAVVFDRWGGHVVLLEADEVAVWTEAR